MGRLFWHTKVVVVVMVMVLVQLMACGSSKWASGAPNTTTVSVLCNSASYTAGDPFTVSLAYVLADLLATTPSRRGHDYYDISPFPNAFAYGHAACAARLAAAAGDCSLCLHFAARLMNTTCGMSVGARAVLVDCTTRYEQYPFVN